MGASSFGNCAKMTGRLGVVGPQGNSRVKHLVLARKMESVRNGSFKPLAIYTGGGKETGDSLHFCSCRNLQILVLPAHVLRLLNKSLSCIMQPLFKLLFLCCVLGPFILLMGWLFKDRYLVSHQLPASLALSLLILKLPELKTAGF